MLIDESCKSELSRIPPLLEKVDRAIRELTGSLEDAFQIKLVLEEALTNAMRHGNRLDASRLVKVRVELSENTIIIDVHDQGEGFDFNAIPDPTVHPNVDKPCGRGVFLMRRIMDKITYYDHGRGVRMEKTLLK